MVMSVLLSSICNSDNFQKLQSLFEDIFEESDSFPASPTPDEIASSKYFSGIGPDGDHPLLASATIEKITRYVLRVQNSKRRCRNEHDGLEWDGGAVRRILKLVQRTMAYAEGVVAFPEDRKPESSGKEEKQSFDTKGRAKGGKKSRSPAGLQDTKDDGVPAEREVGIDEAALQVYEKNLLILRDGGLGAECCLVLLDTEGLSKQASSSFEVQALTAT